MNTLNGVGKNLEGAEGVVVDDSPSIRAQAAILAWQRRSAPDPARLNIDAARVVKRRGVVFPAMLGTSCPTEAAAWKKAGRHVVPR